MNDTTDALPNKKHPVVKIVEECHECESPLGYRDELEPTTKCPECGTRMNEHPETASRRWWLAGLEAEPEGVELSASLATTLIEHPDYRWYPGATDCACNACEESANSLGPEKCSCCACPCRECRSGYHAR